MSADPDWTPAMARRDIADQVEDHNSAIRDEIQAHRDQDWLDTQDDRTPTRAEVERDDFDDWRWDRERNNR